MKISNPLDVPKQLTYLLFLRASWDLQVYPELPPPRMPVPKHALPSDRTQDELGRSWSALWEETAKWETSKLTISPEKIPDWRQRYGSDGIDTQAMSQWVIDSVTSIVTPLMKEPGMHAVVEQNLLEYRDAVGKGLRTVLLLPVVGTYFRWFDRSHLLLSFESRLDLGTYREALAAQP